MKRVLLIIGVICFFIFASNCKYKTTRKEPADLVVRDANIYKVDSARSWAQSLAVRDGRIVYVGSNRYINDFIGKNTQTVDLDGRLLLPGFHDSHMHPIDAGVQLIQCSLSEAESVDEILDLVRSYAQAYPEKPWILGRGWDQTLFPDANPNKSMLDKIVKDRPVMFWDRGGHDIWVNSRALEIAEITSETPNPDGGLIERNPQTGEPTGTLREKAALNFVQQHSPKPTNQEYCEALVAALKIANSYGIVSLQDAKATVEYIKAYSDVNRQGDLTARVRLAQEFFPDKDYEKQIKKFIKLRGDHQSEHLNAGAVKLFIDGVFFNKTAALLEPYTGIVSSDQIGYGMLNFDVETLNHLVRKLDTEGFQVHMHAIGDRAIRMGLDAFEYTLDINGIRDSRHLMAHLHIIHPKDVPRFQRLGIVPVFQPFWADTDDYNMKLIRNYVGPERFKRLHSIRTLMDNTFIVAAGSDWPVTSVNPLDAIQIAVTRRLLERQDGIALNSEERVDLAQIVTAYTIAGAYANFEDEISGSIELGKWADFIVLDKNIFEIPSHEIHTAKVLWTVLEGREVFRAENLK